MHVRSIGALLSGVLVLSCGPAVAQNAERDPVARYLSRKSDQHAAQERAVQALGRGIDMAELSRLVTGRNLPWEGPAFPITADQRAALITAFNREVSNHLAGRGFGTARIRSLQANNIDLLEAARRNVLGQATTAQRAALAEDVVLAEALSSENPGGAPSGPKVESLGDGFQTTQRFRVLETLKGDMPVSTEVAIRQHGTSNDIVPAAGQQFLLFLSRPHYEQESLARGGRPAAGMQGISNAPYAVSGDTLRGTVLGHRVDVTSLSEARAQIRPVAQAFQAAGPR